MTCPYHPKHPQRACPECSFDVPTPRLTRMLEQSIYILNNVPDGDTGGEKKIGHTLRASQSLTCDLVRYIIESENKPITDEAKRMLEVWKKEGAR